jgi:hypothetical protein
MRLADTNLPTVPRGNIQNIIERDTLELLGIKEKITTDEEDMDAQATERKSTRTAKHEI